MKKILLSLVLLLGFAVESIAQNPCALTVTKSGTGVNRIYTCSSNATSPVYSLSLNSSSYGYGLSTNSPSNGVFNVNYTYGGYNQFTVRMSDTSGCADSLVFDDTVVGPMPCYGYDDLFPNPILDLNSYHFNALSAYYSAPGYTKNILFDYGDGTTGAALDHTYSSSPSNMQVVETVTYTHPTQPNCTLKDTTYINPTACMGLAHVVTYTQSPNASYQFTNTVTSVPITAIPGTQWYVLPPLGSIQYYGYGNNFNHTFLDNGIHSLISITIWRDSGLYNAICTTRDTLLVNVTTVTNNLSVVAYVDSAFLMPFTVSPQVKTWLIKKDNLAGTLTAVDSVVSPVVAGWQGWQWLYYGAATANFHDIPSGTYLAKSHIINQPTGLTVGFLPTYVYNQAYWGNADTFVFTGTTNLSKTNVLLTGTPTSGPGFVGGLISASANKGTAEGDPVAGVTVFLRDAAGKVIKMGITDAAGKFGFSNLDAGTYTVYPEELNFSTIASDAINVTTAQSNMAVHFKRNEIAKEYVPGAVLGVGTVRTSSFSVTPNPATDKLQINLSKAAGKVTATLSNAAGQVVMQEVITGSNTELQVAQLPAGMYLLQLQNGTAIHTEKVQIQH